MNDATGLQGPKYVLTMFDDGRTQTTYWYSNCSHGQHGRHYASAHRLHHVCCSVHWEELSLMFALTYALAVSASNHNTNRMAKAL